MGFGTPGGVAGLLARGYFIRPVEAGEGAHMTRSGSPGALENDE